MPEIVSLEPSRFNARARADNGGLILFNTYLGAYSVFAPRNADAVEHLLSQEGYSGELTGLAKYLFERGYLIRKGVDELGRVRELHSKQQYRTDLFELTLLASEQCDFRCVYCYEDFKRGTMAPDVRSAVVRLIERKAPTLSAMKISWFGGEPMLGFEAIEDIAPKALEISKRFGVNYHSAITTNGYLLTKDRFQSLLDWNCRGFQITIDGSPEVHNQNRPLARGGPTFETILDNLLSFTSIQEPFSVAIRVNFGPETGASLSSLLRALEPIKGDSRFQLRYHAVSKLGGANDDKLSVCGLDTWDTQRRLEEMSEAAGFKVEGQTILMDARSGTGVCYAARPYHFIVGADGLLMKCTVALDKNDANIVGQLMPDGSLAVDADKAFRWTRPYFEYDDHCKSCFYVPVCQGAVCPWEIIEHDTLPCPTDKKKIQRTLRLLWRKHAAAAAAAN
jgi:uncharacterized protein